MPEESARAVPAARQNELKNAPVYFDVFRNTYKQEAPAHSWYGPAPAAAVNLPPQVEDEYLTKNSAQFHEHLGFTLAGTFHNCGYKFGRWYDMIWMEKVIGEHRPDQPDIVPYQY